MTNGALSGKYGVVVGVANRRSIAWAIAQAWADAGAKLIFSYQGERVRANVEELVRSVDPDPLLAQCDVSHDDEITSFFDFVRSKTSRIDMMLHSVAYAPKEALEGSFLNTSREAFRQSHDISVYSLIGLAREAAPLLTDGGCILTLSFYGAQKVFPNYNIMGVAKASLEATVRYLAYSMGPQKVRVNAISAGPVNTLAARGISGFGEMIKIYNDGAPLRRSCELSELGQTGLFLATDGAASITGQTLYVDGGYEIMAV